MIFVTTPEPLIPTAAPAPALVFALTLLSAVEEILTEFPEIMLSFAFLTVSAILTPPMWFTLAFVLVPPADTTPYARPSDSAIAEFSAPEVIAILPSPARIPIDLPIFILVSLPASALTSAPEPPTRLPAAALASAVAVSTESVSIVTSPELLARETSSPISILVFPFIIASATETPTVSPPYAPVDTTEFAIPVEFVFKSRSPSALRIDDFKIYAFVVLLEFIFAIAPEPPMMPPAAAETLTF